MDVLLSPFLFAGGETFCLGVHSNLLECTHREWSCQPVNPPQSQVCLILQNQVVIVFFFSNLSHRNAISWFYFLVCPINLYHSVPQRPLKFLVILRAFIDHFSLFAMVHCCNVKFPSQIYFLRVDYLCCFYT